MLIDLAKVFPNSCSAQSIDVLPVETSKIEYLKREYSENDSAKDVLIADNTRLEFTPLDPNGLIDILGILSAEKMLSFYNSNKNIVNNELTNKLIKSAEISLIRYQEKFGL